MIFILFPLILQKNKILPRNFSQMNDDLLHKLKKIAIRFHIDPKNTVGHAARVDTIIRVLSDINKSYKKFLEVEFNKNEDFVKLYENNNKILSTFLDELDLLAVDLNFNSFDISVAPNIIDQQSSLFKDDVLAWKEDSFKSYKNLITGDFSNPQYMKEISDKYSDVERRQIYKPLFSSIGTSSQYTINIKDNTGKVVRTLAKPTNERIKFYLPKVETSKKVPTEKTVLAYIKMKDKGEDGFDIKKGNIKEVLHVEELEHDTYPFSPDYLEFDGTAFILDRELSCNVSYEEDNYILRNEEFDLTVWGESREEIEDAFSFSFYSLYLNFYHESDDKLSKKAQILKQKLETIIKEVIDETKKD